MYYSLLVTNPSSVNQTHVNESALQATKPLFAKVLIHDVFSRLQKRLIKH